MAAPITLIGMSATMRTGRVSMDIDVMVAADVDVVAQAEQAQQDLPQKKRNANRGTVNVKRFHGPSPYPNQRKTEPTGSTICKKSHLYDPVPGRDVKQFAANSAFRGFSRVGGRSLDSLPGTGLGANSFR
jgi:hypothetical protein